MLLEENMKRGWPCVTCVFFEGEAQQSNFFASDCVEEAVNDPAGKPPPLVLIHIYNLYKIHKENKLNTDLWRSQKKGNKVVLSCPHLLPVGSHLRQVEGFTQIH